MENIMGSILEKLEGIPGDKGFYYKNMVTGEVLNYNEEATFIPASIIKLPILMAIFKMASEGKISLEEKLKIKQIDKMPSCGALNSFTDEPEVDVRTLCNLMITISDNTATNVLISRYGTDVLNSVLSEIGLEKTRVNRLLFDLEASKKGIQNSITPMEIGSLLELLHKNVFVSPSVSEDIKQILFLQQIKHKIKERLPYSTKVASKTGDDDNISNDVGIVYAKQPFVVCFISNKTLPWLFNSFIRETSYKLFTTCNE